MEPDTGERTTRERSIGVTLTALAAAVGSALGLLFIAVLAMAMNMAIRDAPNPALARFGNYAAMFIFAGLSIWAAATGYGLWKLRSWGRWSVLIYSGLMACFSTSSALAILFVPIPPTPNAPEGIPSAVRIIGAIVYAFPALLGVFWLYYFNRTSVRAQFDPRLAAGLEPIPPLRPISITIIAVVMILSALSCLLGVFLELPAILPGVVATGIAAHLVFLIYSVTFGWVGIGLLRLDPLSRIVALGAMVFAAINGLLVAILPGSQQRMMDAMREMPWGLGSVPVRYTEIQSGYLLLGVASGVLLNGVAIWLLIRHRPAFQPAPSTALESGT